MILWNAFFREEDEERCDFFGKRMVKQCKDKCKSCINKKSPSHPLQSPHTRLPWFPVHLGILLPPLQRKLGEGGEV